MLNRWGLESQGYAFGEVFTDGLARCHSEMPRIYISAGFTVPPDEITIRIRGSKTDQINLGEVRNQFRSKHEGLCVVEALAALRARFPGEKGGIE